MARRHAGAIVERLKSVCSPSLAPILPILILSLTMGTVELWANDNGDRAIRRNSIDRLESRLTEIDSEIETLSTLTLRSGVGRIGYRSRIHDSPANREWIRIELGGVYPVDQIVLVPVIWRESKKGPVGDGFPVQFTIKVGSKRDTEGTEVASFTESDGLLPRVSPLVIEIPETPVSWMTLEADHLSRSVWEGRFILQFAEILILSGQENVALHSHVEVPAKHESYDNVWTSRNLVDGQSPYLMDAAVGERSTAYVSAPNLESDASIEIDLEKPTPIDRVTLHRVDVNDTVPQSVPSDFGIPRHLIIEGANRPDYSDANTLAELTVRTVYDAGPFIHLRFGETECRFVRLKIREPYRHGEGNLVAFAEIEVLSRGKNAALNAPVKATFDSERHRMLSSITDGHNFYGKILPERRWLNELARRHELENERPLVASSLGQLYAQQRENLNRMRWLAALLAAGIMIAILFDRLIRVKQMSRIRERLAADLHDELGANLHTIGLLSDLAKASSNDKEELNTIHRRIRSETQRSSEAVRRCTGMLEAKGSYDGLVEDMQRTARRVLGNLDHEIIIEGEEHLNKVDPRIGYDLYLFYKECLVNISRHSEATQFETRLTATPSQLCLTVVDNGKGLPEDEGDTNMIPSSLRRRARLLKSKVSVENLEPSGTIIKLLIGRPFHG